MHEHNPPCGRLHARLRGVNVALDGRPVLEGIDLDLQCGEILAVVGPNGGGKTTLLRTLLGQVSYRGSVEIQSIGETRPCVGYVPQHLDFDRESPLCVEDLLRAALARAPVCLPFRTPAPAVDRALEAVGAAHLRRARLGDLSGGELQRVLLALALEPRPTLLLLDEPTTALDPQGLALFHDTVARLTKEFDVAIVLVSHDLAAAARVADRMLLLRHTILALGTPREVLASRVARAAFGLAWEDPTT